VPLPANTARAAGRDPRVTVVVATRDRRDSLLRSLQRLADLPEQPEIIVVDNDSSDGTAAAVRAAFPRVRVVRLEENAGPAGRTVGALAASSPYVAFSDDDSWWAQGSLSLAADLLDAHPRVGLLAARVVVGEDERVDPTSLEMSQSPLAADVDLPGPAVLGFIACGAVLRRSAFLAAGGFDERLGTGAEETLLAVDLASRGWGLTYVDAVVAHHHPSPQRDAGERRRAEVRNELWVAWLRRPLGLAVRRTVTVARAGVQDRAARRALLDVLRGANSLARERRVVAPHVEAGLRKLNL
jgi:GT2 family glycosyltransferase